MITLVGWYLYVAFFVFTLLHTVPVHADPLPVQQRFFPHGKPVTVPFYWKGGLVFVDATVDKKRILCQIDTGNTGVILPQELHLNLRKTGRSAIQFDAFGRKENTPEVILPILRLGGFILKNLYACRTSNLKFLPDTAPPILNLGASAFINTVLTIDYRHQLLTISPSYSPPNYPVHTYPIQWPQSLDHVQQLPGITAYFREEDQFQKTADGHLVFTVPNEVQETIESAKPAIPIHLYLDTGWQENIGISETFYAKIKDCLNRKGLQPTMRAIKHAPEGFQALTIPYLCFRLDSTSLHAMRFIRPATIMPSLNMFGDLVVGPDTLGVGILIIDYVHSQMHLTFSDEVK